MNDPALGEDRLSAYERVADIYATHVDRLRSFATLITANAAEGEDIAQAVFVEALTAETKRPGYLREPVWPWLRTVAARIASKRRRRQWLQRARLWLLWTDVTTPNWTEGTTDTVRALNQLPPRMRACVVLAYLEDVPIRVIAETLGCSKKTVENQLTEGRRRLRLLLTERSYGDE